MNRYSKSYTVKAGTVLLFTLLLLGSCSEDAIFDDKGGNLGAASDNICFGISDKDGWPETRTTRGGDAEETVTGNFVLRSADNADTLCVQTTVSDFGPLPFGGNAPMSRAALVTDGNMHDSFGVTACIYTGEDKAYYFFNEKNTKPADYSSTAIWTYDSGNIYYWPGANHSLRFYAYSPYECKGLATPQETTPGAAPTFNYTVPANATDQTDILTYATGEMDGNTKTSVPLKFDHICTAVQFVVGKEMQPGSIKSITMKGIKNAGSYSFESNEWTLGETTDNFVQNWENGKPVSQTEGAEIMGDDGCFVMLPQTLPDGASVEIVFHDDNTGKDRTLTASLAGQHWPQGKRVKYNISISPDYKFELTDVPEAIDAHYVICKTTLKVTGVPDGKAWTVTAPTLANEAVTIIRQDEMNDYAKQGYWTDRRINQNGTDTGSARGTSSFKGTGSGEFQIAIFVPENAGDVNRKFSLTIKFNGEENTAQALDLNQLCPAWTDRNFGWEQIDDNEKGEFGFCWNRKSMYVIPYNRNNDNYQTAAFNLLKDLIKKYDADTYVKYYDINMDIEGRLFNRNTYAIVIDYSKLDLTGTYSEDNGLSNTSQLQAAAKGATGEEFEKVLSSITKSDAGESGAEANNPLFRHPSDWEISHNRNLNVGGVKGLYKTQGENAPGSGILNYVEKKNCFNLNATYQDGFTVWYPVLRELKWYIPAKGQFGNIPSNIHTGVVSSDNWSSTPVMDKKNAYLGNGSAAERLSTHKVRACRNKP